MSKKSKETKAAKEAKVTAAVEETDVTALEESAGAELLSAETGGEKDYSSLPARERAAFRCKDRIGDALGKSTLAFYDLSCALLEAYDEDYPKVWGFTNFIDYVESELGMKYRSAYYLVEVGRIIKKYNIDTDQAKRIGWTKMKEITSYIQAKPDEASRYLDMAENMSRRELQDQLSSEVKVTDSAEGRPQVMRVSLKLEADAASILSDALALAYGDLGREDVSMAFQHIASEWLVARGGTPGGVTLETWLQYLEQAYGVKLVRSSPDESIDALLSGKSSGEDDDAALEELLSSTEDELSQLTQ
jgi:hypothetical protein